MGPILTDNVAKTPETNLTGSDFWLRLDNAAKIYPAIQNDELTSVFRISVVLKQRVKAKPFLEALRMLEHRFPYYKMTPKKGFFWYYLEYHDIPIVVKADTEIPCRAFEKNGLIFRVLVKEKRISAEFSHILTDGSGAFEFLKSLLLVYFEVAGISKPGAIKFHRPEEKPSEKEFEDSFGMHFKKNMPTPKKITRAFHLWATLKNVPRFDALVAVVSLPAIMNKAKEYKVSLTVYLAAVYLYALQDIYNTASYLRKKKCNKIIRIEVPVNLRKVYPSETMRNFSLYVMPEIDLRLGAYTFEEIVKTVYHLMQLQTDQKLIDKTISRNVGAERNVFIKSTPLFIKSLILYFKYQSAGPNLYSGVITNMGKVNFTPEINNLIDYFVFIPPPPNKTLKVNCGAIGFGDKLVLSFGNITTSRTVERIFFKFLTGQKIPVKIINY